MSTIRLQNVDIPRLGFGTWKLDGNACVAAVKEAIDTGYRHIDTAQAYGNEAAVGDAWKSTQIKRDDLFLTTKIFREQFADQTTAMASIDNSLRKLNTDYVDLLLVHWPFPEYAVEHLIAPLMAAKDQGKARLIGVSNFTLKQMEEARKISNGAICINQVEYHPMLNQQPLLDYTQKYDWGLTAYSPLGRGDILDNDTITGLATRHEKSPAQIVLRWLMQHNNVLAIPKSSHPVRIRENFDIFDFTLTDAEMQSISDLRDANERQVNPDFAPRWDVAA